MPWSLPEDMAHFKETTMGCPVIMGRATWESLPARFRPLPGRDNIVVSRQQAGDWSTGARVVDTIARAAATSSAWVIGGGQIYAATLDFVNTIVVTEIDCKLREILATPVYAPVIPDEFMVSSATPWAVSEKGKLLGQAAEATPDAPLRYRFITYSRTTM